MDDDTLPEQNALAMSLEAEVLVNGEYGFLSSVPIWKDGSGCVMNRPGIARQYEEQLGLLRYGLLCAEQATFVSMFLKADVVRQCGLPIWQFFIWADDIEYSRRLSIRCNLPCYLVGCSQVMHMMDNNTGSNLAIDRPERIDRYRLAFRNECYLYRQEGLRGHLYYARRCAATFKNRLQVATFYARLYRNSRKP